MVALLEGRIAAAERRAANAAETLGARVEELGGRLAAAAAAGSAGAPVAEARARQLEEEVGRGVAWGWGGGEGGRAHGTSPQPGHRTT